MSALAQSPNVFSASRRRGNEEAAIFAISHAALTAVDALSGLETVANAVLGLSGVHEVQIRLHAVLEQTELLEWRHPGVSSPRSTPYGLVETKHSNYERAVSFLLKQAREVRCSPLQLATPSSMARQPALSPPFRCGVCRRKN